MTVNASNTAPMEMVLERYAEMKGVRLELNACIGRLKYLEREVEFDNNFIPNLYEEYKVTHYFDLQTDTAHFSCHEFLKSRHFKNMPNTAKIEKNVYPLFQSKNIFGEHSVTMHEKAWDKFSNTGNGTRELTNITEESSLENSGLEVIQFQQRSLKAETATEIKGYLEKLSGAPVYYDELTNIFAFQPGSYSKSLKIMLEKLDVKVESVDVVVSFLKFSKSSIDDFLVGSASNEIRSENIKKTLGNLNCQGECRYEDFVNYVSGLKPMSDPSSVFQLVNSGLDLEFGAVRVATLTDDRFEFRRGKSTYYLDSKLSLDQSPEQSTIGFTNTPYQIDTGLLITGKVRNVEDQYFVELALSDGDENLSQAQSDISASSQIASSLRFFLNSGEEILVTNMLVNKEVEEKKVMPILGYIPFIGRVFNSNKMVESEQHAFYYIHLH